MYSYYSYLGPILVNMLHYSDDNFLKISFNTLKSPEEVERLAVTQNTEKTHQLKLA